MFLISGPETADRTLGRPEGGAGKKIRTRIPRLCDSRVEGWRGLMLHRWKVVDRVSFQNKQINRQAAAQNWFDWNTTNGLEV